MKTHAFITSIVLALAPFTSASTDLHQPIYENRMQGASEPKVSPEFQAEVSQLTLRGLKLKEAVEASLDGASRHLAAIFQQEKPKAPNEAFEVRIIESDGRVSKTIFRRADFFFSFELAGESNKLNATDINGDGLKEIIAQTERNGSVAELQYSLAGTGQAPRSNHRRFSQGR